MLAHDNALYKVVRAKYWKQPRYKELLKAGKMYALKLIYQYGLTSQK